MRTPGASRCTALPGSAERLVSTRISERARRADHREARAREPRRAAVLCPCEGDHRGGPAPQPTWRRGPRKDPPKVIPKHVKLCQTGQGAIYTWSLDRADRITRRPYRCLSWRHEGPCARREASVTFARIKEACERSKFSADGWVFFVLTLDRAGFYSGDAWHDVQRAFRELSRMSRNFLSRLRRLCSRNGWEDPGCNWVSTVEVHRSGWPHVNVQLYCPELAHELEQARRETLSKGLKRMGFERPEMLAGLERKERREEIGKLEPEQRAAVEELERRAILLENLVTGPARETELLDAATRPMRSRGGRQSRLWGKQSTAERVADRDALASYMVKLAGEMDAAAGELAKLTQVPTNAFEKFRRLRSGKGFLPPRRKNPDITGTMMRRELDPQRSAYGALPLHKCGADPVYAKQVELCARIEGDRIIRELEAHRLVRAGMPRDQAMPPPVEQYALRGENFVVLGSAIVIDGETGFAEDNEGFLKWSPPRGLEDVPD